MNEEILRLEGIEKRYNPGRPNEVAVLRGADLTVGRGEVVALVAPSGAGKSTLLHILRRQEVGFVYQFHHLLPEFTALENIVLPQLANGTPRAAAEEHARALLASVGVESRAEHRPAALSGGEQQRVAFCRAMANTPKLLLADEPTGNLDPATSDTVFGALMSLVRETGLCAVIATHNLELASRMDRQVRLDEGRLVPV